MQLSTSPMYQKESVPEATTTIAAQGRFRARRFETIALNGITETLVS